MNNRVYENLGNEAILSQIKGEKLNILDVGCGAGNNAMILTAQGHCVDGITHSAKEAEICKGRMNRVYLHDLSNGLPPLETKYDLIICSHVLEHLAYPDELLRAMKSVMLADSRLLIALPNIMHYSSRIKLILGKFDYKESGIWDNTHLRWFTFDSAKRLLEICGYQVRRSWVDGQVPAMRLFRFFPKAMREILFNMLRGMSKGLFGSQLLYEVQISPEH